MNFQDELKIALEASGAASKIIRDGYYEARDIHEKENKGIVTEIDLQSEKAILDIIRSNSKHPILSEESEIEIDSETYWVVDPLDGTTNYSRQISLFATSIALIQNNVVKVGVVENPILNERFSAIEGLGAFLNSSRISVSKTDSLKGSVMFLNSGYSKDALDVFAKATQSLADKCYLRKLGTTALELCYLAKGSADSFLSFGDELWDYAAGIIIVQEAGGMVTDWKGNNWNNTNSYIYASNRNVHEELLQHTDPLQS